MYDRSKTRRKIIGMLLTAILMAGMLYAYDINAAIVERGVHAVVSTLSPARVLKEYAIKAEFARGDSPAAAETGSWKGIPVLLYHGIVRKPDRFNMTMEVFKDQMFALKRAGYRTVTLHDFQSFMRGEMELPAKSFLLTFDDGRADSYEGAEPIL